MEIKANGIAWETVQKGWELDHADKLRGWLEHAPAKTAPAPDGLNGWTADGVTICSACAGRLLDRGCRLGEKVAPIWDKTIMCDLCFDRKPV